MTEPLGKGFIPEVTVVDRVVDLYGRRGIEGRRLDERLAVDNPLPERLGQRGGVLASPGRSLRVQVERALGGVPDPDGIPVRSAEHVRGEVAAPDFIFLEAGGHHYAFDKAMLLHSVSRLLGVSVILEREAH